MVHPRAPYSDVSIDTFIFCLRSLCKIIWMNIYYFPNDLRLWSCALLYIDLKLVFLTRLKSIKVFFSSLNSIQLSFSKVCIVYGPTHHRCNCTWNWSNMLTIFPAEIKTYLTQCIYLTLRQTLANCIASLKNLSLVLVSVVGKIIHIITRSAMLNIITKYNKII